MEYPFAWLDGATLTLSATTTSSNGALLKVPTGEFQIRLCNEGSSTVFIRKGGDSTVVATTADLPVLSGGVEVLTINNHPDAPISYIAAITGTGTATLHITTGLGI